MSAPAANDGGTRRRRRGDLGARTRAPARDRGAKRVDSISRHHRRDGHRPRDAPVQPDASRHRRVRRCGCSSGPSRCTSPSSISAMPARWSSSWPSTAPIANARAINEIASTAVLRVLGDRTAGATRSRWSSPSTSATSSRLTPEQAQTGKWILMIIAIHISMNFPFSVFGGIISGFQRYDANNMVAIATQHCGRRGECRGAPRRLRPGRPGRGHDLRAHRCLFRLSQ